MTKYNVQYVPTNLSCHPKISCLASPCPAPAGSLLSVSKYVRSWLLIFHSCQDNWQISPPPPRRSLLLVNDSGGYLRVRVRMEQRYCVLVLGVRRARTKHVQQFQPGLVPPWPVGRSRRNLWLGRSCRLVREYVFRLGTHARGPFFRFVRKHLVRVVGDRRGDMGW